MDISCPRSSLGGLANLLQAHFFGVELFVHDRGAALEVRKGVEGIQVAYFRGDIATFILRNKLKLVEKNNFVLR